MDNKVTQMNADFSIPITQLRAKLRTLLTAPGLTTRAGSKIAFTNEIAPVVGVPNSVTYQSEDELIDAVLHAWFPNAYRQAA